MWEKFKYGRKANSFGIKWYNSGIKIPDIQ